MDVQAAKMIGAGLCMIALLGVGIGLGNIFSKLYQFCGAKPIRKRNQCLVLA